jgi:hypothetical protein
LFNPKDEDPLMTSFLFIIIYSNKDHEDIFTICRSNDIDDKILIKLKDLSTNHIKRRSLFENDPLEKEKLMKSENKWCGKKRIIKFSTKSGNQEDH